MFGLTVLHADGGKMSKALAEVDKQYALGEKTKDVPAMAGDLQLKGNILLEMGKAAEAKAAYERGQEIKDNNKRVIHNNLARVALAQKDLTAAKTEAEEFRKGAEASRNPAQIRLAHELAGMIALAEKDYDKALSELQMANQQNPRNLYRMCQAHEAKGDKEKAKELCKQAAEFNSLPQLNYAFIRTKAKAAAEKS
jgi:tetratricopeptide (TPR) repeat protein